MLLSSILDIALFVLVALSLLLIVVAAFLPQPERKRLLQRLTRKWIF